MSDIDDLARIVEFKLLLSRLTEQYVFHELNRAARAQRRRLPAVARTCLRAGSIAAVEALKVDELLEFAQSRSWDESVAHAVRSGAWGRLIEDAVRRAFPVGAN